MTFQEQWIEYDYNPFIVFDQDGRVKTLNQEAQHLLGKVSNREIFDLATHYASSSFGFKTHFLDLEYDRFEFFAIMVGYEKEDEIGIRLYKRPKNKIKNLSPTNSQLTSLYVLVDLAMSTAATSSKADFSKEFDPALPEFLIAVDSFMKLTNKIYQYYQPSLKIATKIYMKIGEYVKTDGKKHQIIRVEVIGDYVDGPRKHEALELAQDTQYAVYFKDERVFVDIPMILG